MVGSYTRYYGFCISRMDTAFSEMVVWLRVWVLLVLRLVHMARNGITTALILRGRIGTGTGSVQCLSER